MNERREFFRRASIFGVAAIAPVATTVVISLPKEEKVPEDISHLQPENPTTLTLTVSKQEYQNKVDMTVGKDNRLWIKVNDEWKRVAIES